MKWSLFLHQRKLSMDNHSLTSQLFKHWCCCKQYARRDCKFFCIAVQLYVSAPYHSEEVSCLDWTHLPFLLHWQIMNVRSMFSSQRRRLVGSISSCWPANQHSRLSDCPEESNAIGAHNKWLMLRRLICVCETDRDRLGERGLNFSWFET